MSLIKSVWEGNIMALEQNIKWKKGKGEKISSSHNIKAVGKNIKLGREEE